MRTDLLNDIREILEDNLRMRKYILETQGVVKNLRRDLWYSNNRIIEKILKDEAGDS